MAPDTRDQHHVVKGPAFFFKAGKDILECVLEGKVSAAGTPGVLRRSDQVPGHEGSTSCTRRSSSSGVNGRPSYFRIVASALTPCSRASAASCPVAFSSTAIRRSTPWHAAENCWSGKGESTTGWMTRSPSRAATSSQALRTDPQQRRAVVAPAVPGH